MPDFSHTHALFPIKDNLVYLNNASIVALSTRVTAAVNELLNDVQQQGRINYPNWCRIADTTFKANIARLIGAAADEIALVKNTTEGILIVANGLDWQPGDNIIVAEQEYASNVYCWGWFFLLPAWFAGDDLATECRLPQRGQVRGPSGL